MKSLRVGFYLQGAALAALSLAAACSNSSPPSGNSGTKPNPFLDAGAESQPVMKGNGMECPKLQTSYTTAALITLNVNWPSSVATNECLSSQSPPCSAPFYIWLKTDYTVNGTDLMVKSRTCGNVSPPVPLSGLGRMATCGNCSAASVLNDFHISTWDAKDMPVTTTTGKIGGTTVGSTTTIDTSTTLLGLSATSKWSDPSVKWPDTGSGFNLMTDVADADDDGQPGITGIPRTTDGFYAPRVTANMSSPTATALDIVSRTTLSLYGTSTSCTDVSGTAYVNQLENHIVGCVQDDGTRCVDGDPGQGSGWIDSNSPKFFPGIGTFVAKILDKGSAATCDDVLAALPQPGTTDGGTMMTMEAGVEDAGSPDATMTGTPDGSTPDGSTPDAGATDN